MPGPLRVWGGLASRRDPDSRRSTREASGPMPGVDDRCHRENRSFDLKNERRVSHQLNFLHMLTKILSSSEVTGESVAIWLIRKVLLSFLGISFLSGLQKF